MGGRLRNEEVAERFGRNLFHARRHAGFSQDELARLTSLHRTEISLIERGRRLPRVDTLIKLTSALAVGVDQLIWGVGWIITTPTRPGSFAVEPAGQRRG
jgi:transcriptional regulator with XRE-family HTH domain